MKLRCRLFIQFIRPWKLGNVYLSSLFRQKKPNQSKWRTAPLSETVIERHSGRSLWLRSQLSHPRQNKTMPRDKWSCWGFFFHTVKKVLVIASVYRASPRADCLIRLLLYSAAQKIFEVKGESADCGFDRSSPRYWEIPEMSTHQKKNITRVQKGIFLNIFFG